MTLHHASCVDIDGKAVLIFGSPGSGKSDLAVRLMDAGGTLVSDDYVDVKFEDGLLLCHPAPNIEGLIEIRGVGLVKVDNIKSSPLHLVLELVGREDIERLPEKHYFRQDGIEVSLYKFDAFSVSAIAKIRMLLNK